MTRTKIVCTIGPASRDEAVITRMVEAGMNVARLNFSHGTREEHARAAEKIREVSRRAGRSVAVLQDLSGPKIRIGPVAGGAVDLKPGDSFALVARPVQGDRSRVSVTYAGLPEDVRPGDPIYLGDGVIELEVVGTGGDEVRCRVVVGGTLVSHKGLNLPSRSISTPILTEKDKEDLAFGIDLGVDYVALSFVRSASDIQEARRFLEGAGGDLPLVAKIEKHEALDRIDEILDRVDGIMIARGDLGVEIPVERVPRVQKMLIQRANDAGKPVITATQMLRSMVESPRPTRAEVTDVANAILDGSDAVMLSEESAVGRYPVESVRMLNRVAAETEPVFPHDLWASRFPRGAGLDLQEAVAAGAVAMARDVGAAAILTCTHSGSTSRLVAKYRPAQPILAITSTGETFRRLALLWGTVPLFAEAGDLGEDLEAAAVGVARRAGAVKEGDRVVIAAGLPMDMKGITNHLQVVTVGS